MVTWEEYFDGPLSTFPEENSLIASELLNKIISSETKIISLQGFASYHLDFLLYPNDLEIVPYELDAVGINMYLNYAEENTAVFMAEAFIKFGEFEDREYEDTEYFYSYFWNKD